MKCEDLQDTQTKNVILKSINEILKQKYLELEQHSSDLHILLHEQIQSNKFRNTDSNLLRFASLIIRQKYLLFFGIISFTLFLVFNPNFNHTQYGTITNGLNSNYVIQNLRGDTVTTWKKWNWVEGTPMAVVINLDAGVPVEKFEVIRNAITSENFVIIDDSKLHKGPSGTSSKYFLGWSGAIKNIQNKSLTSAIPNDFIVKLSNNNEGRIVITLTNLVNGDGYSGYTKSIVENNEILKSYITIFDVSRLSDEQLQAISRHEFGHALGLEHSSAPEDLMAPIITTEYPYISDCVVEALVALYNEGKLEVVCEK